MQIETDFLSSQQVNSQVDFNTIFNLQNSISNAKKSKFDKSIKLSKLVVESCLWFAQAETKSLLEEEGIEWNNQEVFFNRVFGWQKSFGQKMLKAGKLEQSIVTKFKRECTRAENNGESTNRSIEQLLKFAKAEQNQEETSVATEKTFVTFSVAKDGLNGDTGFSMRLTESGIKCSGELQNEDIDRKINRLFIEMQVEIALLINQNQNQ